MADEGDKLDQLKADRESRISLYNDQIQRFSIVSTFAAALIVVAASSSWIDPPEVKRLDDLKGALDIFSGKHGEPFLRQIGDRDLQLDHDEKIDLLTAEVERRAPQLVRAAGYEPVPTFIKSSLKYELRYDLTALPATEQKLTELKRAHGDQLCKDRTTPDQNGASVLDLVQMEFARHPRLNHRRDQFKCPNAKPMSEWLGGIQDYLAKQTGSLRTLSERAINLLDSMAVVKELSWNDLLRWKQLRADWKALWDKFQPAEANRFRGNGSAAEALSKAEDYVLEQKRKAEGERPTASILGLEILISKNFLWALPFALVIVLGILRILIVQKRCAQNLIVNAEETIQARLDGLACGTYHRASSSRDEIRNFAKGDWEVVIKSNPQFLTELAVTLTVIVALVWIMIPWIRSFGLDILGLLALLALLGLAFAVARLVAAFERKLQGPEAEAKAVKNTTPASVIH